MTYVIQNGLKNNSFSPNKPGALNSRKPQVTANQIVPPNPIDPFNNPAQIPRQITIPGLFNVPQTFTLTPNGIKVEDTDYTYDILSPFRDEFNKNKVDIIVGVIAIVMIIIAIVQIAKPI